MASAKQHFLRDGRDHLIDLLGLGQTYPLQNLPLYLPADPYLVTYNNPARIGIETSQRTVLYRLHENSQPVEHTPEGQEGPGMPVERPGNQARIRLSSNEIQEDKTFQIYALKFMFRFALSNLGFVTELDQAQVSAALRQEFEQIGKITLANQVVVSLEKQPLIAPTAGAENNAAPESVQRTLTWVLRDSNDPQSGDRFLIRHLDNVLAVYEMSERAVYLHQEAEVRVGLDKTLRAWIIEPFFLDAGQDNQPLAARLIDYDGVVTVEIDNSQEGVYYRLIKGELDESGTYPANPPPDQDTIISVDDDEGNELGKLGTGENISVATTKMREDLDIRIRATKTFPAADGRASETTLLEVILPLRVRANPDPAVSITPAPIVDFNQAPNVTLDSSQHSASYSLYIRPIPNREFIHGATEADVVTVSVPDEADVQVPQPPRPHPWQDNAAYVQVGNTMPGTGEALLLPLEALTEDSVVIIRAEKYHRPDTFDQPDSQVIPSAVQLNQAALVLVRPNPAPALRLEVILAGAQTNGDMAVFDGQPGVFYAFPPAPTDDPLRISVYFHQQGDFDQAQNRGVGQLAIDVDFVVPRTHPDGQPLDPARTPPASPILATGPLVENVRLAIQAIKAQTRVKADLAQTALIAALPEIRPEEAIVDYNADTRLLVIASVVGDRYQPFFNGEVFKQARHGNGNNLVFRTDPLVEDTVYEIRVTQPEPNDIPVTRIVHLLISVRPNPNLALDPEDIMVEPGSGTTIRVVASQVGVSYQLLILGDSTSPVGEPVVGSGDTISLPSGPIAATTRFGVWAAKLNNAAAVVDLSQSVTIQVEDDEENGNIGEG